MTLEQAKNQLGHVLAEDLLEQKRRGRVEVSFFLKDIPASVDRNEVLMLHLCALLTLMEGWCPPIGLPFVDGILFTVKKHMKHHKKAIKIAQMICR
jgi:hypothetical protein